MDWIEASIKTQSDKIDELCSRLEDLGIEGMSIEDERDFQNFLDNNHQYWDYVDDDLTAQFAGKSLIKFYVSGDDEGRAKIKEVSEALGMEIATKEVKDEDWENNWRDYYQPLEIGERLLVIPEWLDADLGDRVALRLDPGLIFGTGSHATTRMCLKALQEVDLSGKNVLDLGCGSGILGIGAKVLGCRSVVGCDIDPKAPDVALSNAMLNGITEENFKVYAGDILSDEGMRKFLGVGYDLVLANIVSDVIIPLSAFVRRFMAPDALFICSGIIDGRQDEVEAAIRGNGLEILSHRNEEEWHCFVCKIA